MPGNQIIALRIKDAVERSIQTSKCYPVIGEITLTSGSANVQGSMVEMIASTATRVKIESIAIYGLSAVDRYTVQIAVGAADTVVSTVSVGGAAAASFVVPVTCPEISITTKISCSAASVSGSDTCKVVINYVEIT